MRAGSEQNTTHQRGTAFSIIVGVVAIIVVHTYYFFPSAFTRGGLGWFIIFDNQEKEGALVVRGYTHGQSVLLRSTKERYLGM